MSSNSKIAMATAMVAVGASLVHATAGIVDNTAVAAKIKAAAVPLSGNYRLQAADSSSTLVFEHATVANIYPSGGSVASLVKSLLSAVGLSSADQDQLHFSDVFALSADSDNGVMIKSADAEKAIAAAWNEFDDFWAAAYAYGDQSTGTVRDAKWYWYLVPCGGGGGGSSSSSSGSSDSKAASAGDEKFAEASSKTSAKASPTSSAKTTEETKAPSTCNDHPGKWINEHKEYIEEHPECKDTLEAYQAAHPEDSGEAKCMHPGWWVHRHKGYVTDHPECETALKNYVASQKRSVSHAHGRRHAGNHLNILEKRRIEEEEEASTLSKRGGDTYCIVAKDHILDMVTRAITTKAVDAFDGMKAAALADYDPSAPNQHWKLIPADE